jgi:acylphosphatase
MAFVRRVHVWVTGSVQGVFFRATCIDRARELGLAGWVRNTLDGRVEAEFEGDDGALGSILDWCREGPPLARVESVEVRDKAPTGEQGFRATR